jgi:tRNA modification GTPase
VHCHGGTAAAEAVLAALESRGAVRLSPDDWLRAEEPDLIAAEAHAALAEAKTERTALILLDQYHGALRREVETILDCFARGDHATAQLKLTRLQQLSKVGQHLTTPWRIAIVGPPNVGKSSLMNALVGYSRSIVFDQPGTTRDLIRAETAFDGWPVELIDTAGLRATGDAIESAGVDLAQQAMASADLCLRISDAVGCSVTRAADDPAPTSTVPELAVCNKIDLLPPTPPFAWPGPQVSAKTGQGLPELMHSIVQSLLGIAPLRGEAVPFTSRQIALIDEVHRAAEEQQFDSAAGCLRQIGRS